MSRLLTPLFILFAMSCFSQANIPWAYKKCPPSIGQSDGVLIFRLLTDKEINDRSSTPKKIAFGYNEQVIETANKIYMGEKVFLNSDEIAELDYDEANYIGIFEAAITSGINNNYNDYTSINASIVYVFDINSATKYRATNIYKKGGWTELKKGIKFAEKCRQKG